MAAEALAGIIRQLARREPISGEALHAAFGDVMRGEGSAPQVAALLMALRVKGETPEEVAGVVRALRDAMRILPARDPDGLVDTCGTGGGTLTTFNISTAAALLAAGCGVRVAKHGNRSFTSRSGSADAQQAPGIAIDLSPLAMAEVLEEAGIVFMFAPLMHPALRHVGPVRRELGVPTVMNLVGPLANPARAGRQVVGVAEPARLDLMAKALAHLGAIRALVVNGSPGMDELSPIGPTEVREVRFGRVHSWTIEPEALAIPPSDPADLTGGDPAENAAVIHAVLSGGGPTGARQAVLLNAAAALYVASDDLAFEASLARARDGLSTGRGREALERLRRATRRAASGSPEARAQ